MTFDEFWLAYPKKHHKAECQRRWAMMTPAEQKAATEAAQVYLELWNRADPDYRQFFPYPNTFLDQRRWEDNMAGLAKRVGAI